MRALSADEAAGALLRLVVYLAPDDIPCSLIEKLIPGGFEEAITAAGC